MRTTAIFTATMTFGLVGCGDDSSASSGGGGASGGGGGASTSSGEGGSDGFITRAALIGTWATSCYVEFGTNYAQSVKTFSETDTVTTYDQYENDPTCSDPTKLFVTSTSTDSAWSLGAVLPGGEIEYDRVNAGSVYTTVTEVATSNWNDGSGCGPFSTGVPVDVSGQVCYGYPVAEIGGTQYDVIFPDPQGIRFGSPASGNGSTPELRPKTPEPNEKGIFRKQ